MYNRKYSLKTRYNFNKVFKEGRSYKTPHLIILFLNISPDVLKGEPVDKKFAVVASSKFHKRAVIKNRVRRIIAEQIRLKLEKFPSNHYYVIIPKKEILNESSKVDKRISKEISTEFDTFLSKMALI